MDRARPKITPHPTGPSHAAALRRGALLVLCALVAAGCVRDDDLDTYYGRTSGMVGGKSVNGTAVLADLYEQQGHTVIIRRALTPTLADSADVIVWAPDSYEPPSDEVVAWFDDWLYTGSNRRLIYIGRDFDAGPLYWQKVMPGAPPTERAEMQRRLNEATLEDISRHDSAAASEAAWFDIDRSQPRRDVRTLDGPWAEGVDATKVEIVLRDRMIPHAVYLDETLLASEGEMLVARYREPHWSPNSDVILVANGSFLLNLPLVNHEHRRLASKLVADSEMPGTVVFLESGPGGPSVLDAEPTATIPTGLGQFAIWPQSIVLLHLAAAGIILCFARWPIFGRARRPEKPPLGDFGQHVTAVGELMEATRDPTYARSRHQQYQQSLRNESTFRQQREK